MEKLGVFLAGLFLLVYGLVMASIVFVVIAVPLTIIGAIIYAVFSVMFSGSSTGY